MINRPEFRVDLVSRPLEQNGQVYVDVTDPDTGNTFRFYEVEYAMACAMDGSRDLGGLVDWSREELGLEPTANELELIVNTLEDLGYLKGVPARFIAGETSADDFAPQLAPMQVTPPQVARREASDTTPVHGDMELGHPSAMGDVFSVPTRVAEDAVELGNAGRSPYDLPPSRPSPVEDIPLGMAGGGQGGPAQRYSDESDFSDLQTANTTQLRNEPSAHERPTRRAVAAAASDDVSVDLSQHLAIGAEDVREAVRQSKVLPAVQLPVGFDEESEDDREITYVDTPPQPAPTAPDYGAHEHAAAEEAERAGRRAADEAARHAQHAAAQQAQQQAAMAAQRGAQHAPAAPARKPQASASIEQPTEQPSGSRTVILIIVLLVLAGAAFWYWWSFLREPDQATGAAPPAETATASTTETAATPTAGKASTATAPAEQKPAEPARPTATIKAGEAEQKELTAPRAAEVAWVPAAGSDVEASAPVAKLAGYINAEKALAAAEGSQARYQAKYDKAAAGGDKGEMADAEANVKRKQIDIDKAKAELAKYVVTAPIAGTVEPIAKVRDRVAVGAPIVRITQQKGPQATFELPAGATARDVGAKVKLRDKADPELPAVTCEVSKLEGAALTVTCPSDTNLTDGTAVTLE